MTLKQHPNYWQTVEFLRDSIAVLGATDRILLKRHPNIHQIREVLRAISAEIVSQGGEPLVMKRNPSPSQIRALLPVIEVQVEEITGAPDWVPEGATIFIETRTAGEYPSGRAWVRGVGEVPIDELLGRDERAEENVWEQTGYSAANLTSTGYFVSSPTGVSALAFVGATLETILSGCTLVVQLKRNATPNYAVFLVAGESGDKIMEVDIKESDGDVEFFSDSDFDSSLAESLNLSAGDRNVIAITTTPTRLEVAVNGDGPAVMSLSEADYPTSGPNQISLSLLDVASQTAASTRLETITFYSALPTSAGLTAKSEMIV